MSQKTGVQKVYRDTIDGNRLRGMDVCYIVPTYDDLKNAMGLFTKWLDLELAGVAQNIVQSEATNQ